MNEPDSLLKQFNETIGKWIAYLDDYTLEMLCQKPQPDSWSLGQVYVHIMDDTGYFITQMKICLLSDANAAKEMHGDAKVIFANGEFPDALLVGPATNSSVRQPETKDELLQGLTLIKDEVNRLFIDFDLKKVSGKTEHPGLLFFSASEWLAFAEMHMRHHFRQKNRIDDLLFHKHPIASKDRKQ